MKTVKVTFNSVEECRSYINIAENFPHNIDLLCGSRMIDGKSILGTLSFGLRKVLELRIHGDNDGAVEEFLNKIGFCVCGEDMKIAI